MIEARVSLLMLISRKDTMHAVIRSHPEIADRAPERLAIVYRPIAELRPDPKNPRTHSRKQVEQIAKSITSFGFNVPILVDARLNVVAGHGRLLACRKLGWKELPTVSLDHLTAAQAKAFLIADNRLTENSEWSDRLLAEAFQELSLLDLDFSLDATGFELADIDLRIESLNAPEEEEDDPADQLSAASGPAVSEPGDVWRLGPHRIVCGSALDEATYARLLDDDKAALVFTDPPYNVPVDGHVSGNGAVRHRDSLWPPAKCRMRSSPASCATPAACWRRTARPARSTTSAWTGGTPAN
jgi:ParB-like chromosome segregation protein Spo0J